MKYKGCFAVFGLVMMIFGCGYHFSGGGDLPYGIKTVFVPVFENRSSETGIETSVTNDFIFELTRGGKMGVDGKEMADAILSGVITAVTTQTVSRIGTQVPLERRVRLFMDVKLIDRQGKVLWAIRRFSDNESYAVSENKLVTEQRKRAAIKIISGRMAEMIYYQLTGMD